MNLFSQLVISLITAGAATAALIQLHISQPLHVGIAIAIACCVTPLLNAVITSARSRKRSPRPRRSSAHSESDGDREEGEVKWFNVSKGFGFIRRDNDEEIFVHFRSIRSSNPGRRGLSDGQRVSFIVVDSDKGPQAEDVDEI
jgi:CspA family cold shock protein